MREMLRMFSSRRICRATVGAVAALAVLLSLSSCIEDYRGQCRYPLYVKMRCVDLRRDSNLLVSEVDSVSLIALDRNGAVAGIARYSVNGLSNATARIDLPAGLHSLAVWGGALKHYNLNYDHDTRAVAATSGCIRVVHGADSIVRADSAHLFHGHRTGIAITGDLTDTLLVDLQKKSNLVRLRLFGLSAPDIERIDARILASTGHYGHDGQTHRDAPLQWVPARTEPDSAGVLTRHFSIQELQPGDDTRLRIVLPYDSVHYRLIYDGSLTELIARNPNIDFTKDHDFDVTIEVEAETERGVTGVIRINDWIVIELREDLG